MPASPPTTIIHFYNPDIKGEDDRGRTLDDILSWDDLTLEHTHDYIQTLFPLPEPSGVRDNAPLITSEVRQAFMDRPELRRNLVVAFHRMLSFFGLEYENIQDPRVRPAITQGPNWYAACPRWVVHRSHNHLRISRIIRCLRVLDCQEEAAVFYDFLEHDETLITTVSGGSHAYWYRAANHPIWVPPHDFDSTVVGTAWLRP